MTAALVCSGHMNLAILAENGAFAGFLDVKNTVQLEISSQGGQEIVQTSRLHADYGQARSSAIIPAPSKITIGMDDQGDKDIIAAHLLGEQSVLTQTGAPFTDEPVVVFTDRWSPIGTLRNLKTTAPAPSATDQPGTGTYDINDDFIVDPIPGLIKALSGGAITDGETIKVSGETKDINGTRIIGGRQKFLRSRIFFDGLNLMNGRRIQINIPQVDLTPNNGINFMSQQVANSDFVGTLKTVLGQAPFTIDEFDLAA